MFVGKKILTFHPSAILMQKRDAISEAHKALTMPQKQNVNEFISQDDKPTMNKEKGQFSRCCRCAESHSQILDDKETAIKANFFMSEDEKKQKINEMRAAYNAEWESQSQNTPEKSKLDISK